MRTGLSHRVVWSLQLCEPHVFFWRRMYAFDVHCNSYLPLFLLLYGERYSCQLDAALCDSTIRKLQPVVYIT